MTNRLADETSPYLLQHAENPVDWYSWGEEALERSKQEEKPIFLSIGYSACHWCHVMERESFEDHEIAGVLNDNFVCIKVDREERPDLDHIYMQAVQILTGRGGWPMSVFLTPDLEPFFGGTYWPPRAKMNIPGFDRVLHAVLDAWQNRRQQAVTQAKQLASHIAASTTLSGEHELNSDMLPQAAALLRQQFDHTHGGFGMAPKFPQPMNLQLLLRVWSRRPSQEWVDMVRLNLDKMASGGIYDHLAGGFARYSVDERWLVPHFEKMLYDNALLADAYLDGYLITRDDHYAQVARETLDYTLNYMTDDLGAFHSAEDADSEGEEGKFYVWTPDEVREILGQELGERFCYLYDVTEAGNFEGKNILNLPKTLEQCARIKSWDVEPVRAEMLEARQRLLEVRDRRVRPTKDDKILVSWNGLMIHSMARAGGALGEDRYVIAATRAADFILENMRRQDGRLLHAWRAGRAKFDAYLDDYACLGNALVTLYEATFEERWIDHAVKLMETVLRHFADASEGGFFFTADDHEQLIARTKDFQDNASPSGNAMAATAFLRLGKLCGRTDFVEAAEGTLRMAAGLMREHPIAAGQMLLALDTFQGPTHEIVVLGDGAETQAVLREVRQHYHSTCVLASRRGEDGDTLSPCLSALFDGKTLQGESPTLYVCQDFACQEPAHGKAAAVRRITELLGADEARS